MKKAHSENRAYNIGMKHWKNLPSYPEEWFTKVIENEFSDKNYIYQYHFYKYRLDFAWVDKKKCIEMDGEQHQRFQRQIESDKRKDKKLIDNGWKILRIPWKDCYANPKKYIEIAKNFIELN
jgi:very-short-patch-repair endonuclease